MLSLPVTVAFLPATALLVRARFANLEWLAITMSRYTAVCCSGQAILGLTGSAHFVHQLLFYQRNLFGDHTMRSVSARLPAVVLAFSEAFDVLRRELLSSRFPTSTTMFEQHNVVSLQRFRTTIGNENA